MKNLRTLFAIILILAISVTNSSATNPGNSDRPMYEVHSMMVYNFMKYIYWPPTSSTGDFVIGVVGDTDVFETLTNWYGTKSKGNQKIIIKQFSNASEVTDCHVLYIGKSKSSSFGEIKNKLSGKSTLVITDKLGLGKKGSVINFKTVDNKLKFELNQSAVEGANLKVSSQLAGMAIVI